MTSERFNYKKYNETRKKESDSKVLSYLNKVLSKEKNSFLESYLLQEKIDVLTRIGDHKLLKEVAEEALDKYPENPNVLYSYAKVLHLELMRLGKNDQQKVLQGLDNVEVTYKKADTYFDIQKFETLRNDFSNENIDLPVALRNIDAYFDRKMEIMSKIQEIQQLRYNYNLYISNIAQNNNLQKIRDDFDNSKIQHFEMLGLFSAIIALVVANVSAFSALNFKEIILTNIFVVFSFIILLSFSSNMIGVSRNNEQQNLLMGMLFFMGFVLCFAIYFLV